jgi:hypothetical protein
MDEQDVANAIGCLLVASGVLAGTAGLLLGFVGLLIAGHAWAAVVVLALTLARYGYYLYRRSKDS